MQDDLGFNTVISNKPDSRYVILSPYRCKVFFPSGEWGLFGRGGGVDALRGLQFFPAKDTSRPGIIIGNFCEFASSFIFALGGEHHNEHVINGVFPFFPIARGVEAGQENTRFYQTKSSEPITLGSNVIVSNNVTILSGINIGDGAVIGAGSVVTKDVPPYAIVAGNPARLIRYRVPEECIDDLLKIGWWNWATSFLAGHLKSMHALCAREFIDYCRDLKPIPPVHAEGLLCFQLNIPTPGHRILQFQGVEINGRAIGLHRMPPKILEYIGQMNAPAGATISTHPMLFSFLEEAGVA